MQLGTWPGPVTKIRYRRVCERPFDLLLNLGTRSGVTIYRYLAEPTSIAVWPGNVDLVSSFLITGDFFYVNFPGGNLRTGPRTTQWLRYLEYPDKSSGLIIAMPVDLCSKLNHICKNLNVRICQILFK